MTEYSGGSRRRRGGGTCYVDEPAKGFFVAGSSIEAMNGIFGRIHPTSAKWVDHPVALAYKHDITGWFMCLVETEDEEEEEEEDPYSYYRKEVRARGQAPGNAARRGATTQGRAGQEGRGVCVCVCVCVRACVLCLCVCAVRGGGGGAGGRARGEWLNRTGACNDAPPRLCINQQATRHPLWSSCPRLAS